MGWISKIFADNNAVTKTLDIIGSVADDSSFTNEEKSKFFLEYFKVTAHQSPARRAIALAVTGVWCSIVVLCSLCALFDFDDQKDSLLTLLTEVANPPFMLVLAFYFMVQFAKK